MLKPEQPQLEAVKLVRDFRCPDDTDGIGRCALLAMAPLARPVETLALLYSFPLLQLASIMLNGLLKELPKHRSTPHPSARQHPL